MEIDPEIKQGPSPCQFRTAGKRPVFFGKDRFGRLYTDRAIRYHIFPVTLFTAFMDGPRQSFTGPGLHEDTALENTGFFHNSPLLYDVLVIAGVSFLCWLLIQVNHLVFHNIKKNRKGIEVIFFERVTTVLIISGCVILIFSLFGVIQSIWKTLLGGTAIVSAVLAFAGQDIIKDILAGLMISIYRPFEIGNRIELEDGTAGIVTDITMRHVVLKLMDTQVKIIPNSRLNAMSIKNLSYHSAYRAREFTFHIAYGSDVEKARRVILQAVTESKYTVPGKEKPNGMEYAPVYFMAFDGSSLKLMTTVYYLQSTPTETMITDINLRVNNMFAKYGIEIPFTYINVIQKQDTEIAGTEEMDEFVGRAPGVPLMTVSSLDDSMEKAINATAKLGTDCGLEKRNALRLRLLSEEMFGMMRGLVGDVEASFWVWQDHRNFALHLQAYVTMNLELRRKLLSVSSSGRNDAARSFTGRIREMLYVATLRSEADGGYRDPGIMGMGMYSRGGGKKSGYTWSMRKYKSGIEKNKDNSYEADEAWDQLEKSIVAKVADEVRIRMDGPSVEIIIYKKF